MSSLSNLQKEYTACIAELILWCYEHGNHELTLGDAYRDPRLHGNIGIKKSYGHKSSNHKRRLAIDFNLFNERGDYLTKTESYKFLGEKWKTLHQQARWGGDFRTPDGNHFSFEYGGCQ